MMSNKFIINLFIENKMRSRLVSPSPEDEICRLKNALSRW